MAILQEIEKKVDEIMDILNSEDCDEVISIHVTRNVGLFRLKVNDETYSRIGREWRKLV